MAILILSSTNENFSWIISKNPSNPLTIQTIRKGKVLSFFKDNSRVSYFTDSPQENSFSNKEYSYLDVSSMVSPLAYLAIITEEYNSAYKKPNDLDTKGYVHSCSISALKIKERDINLFTKFFIEKDNTFSFELLAKETYSVTIISKKSIHYLLNLVNVFLLFATLKDEESFLFIREDIIKKYANCLKVVKPKYYIINLLKVLLFNSKRNFKEFKHELESCCRESVVLSFGNTLQARKDYVLEHFKEDLDLIDVGAGAEGNYLFLSRKLNPDRFYYPVDIDKEVRDSITRKINYKKYLNVAEPIESIYQLFKELDKVLKVCPTDRKNTIQVLLTEVLEHMSWVDAQKILEFLTTRDEVNSIIITLPNQKFNENYLIPEGEFRHEDHEWEPDMEDCIHFLQSCHGVQFAWDYTFSYIGDLVNNQAPSIGIYLTRKP